MTAAWDSACLHWSVLQFLQLFDIFKREKPYWFVLYKNSYALTCDCEVNNLQAAVLVYFWIALSPILKALHFIEEKLFKSFWSSSFSTTYYSNLTQSRPCSPNINVVFAVSPLASRCQLGLAYAKNARSLPSSREWSCLSGRGAICRPILDPGLTASYA